MRIFEIPKELEIFISTYDKVNYKLWNDEVNKNIGKFRVAVRKHYLAEQHSTCFYCKQYICSTNGLHWQVEHILPKSLFPQFLFEPRNLIVICPDCNREKSDQNPHIDGDRAKNQLNYPSTSGRFKIIHPLYDIYDDHIDRISASHCDYPDHYFLKAKSSKGKATVKMCDLNRFYQDFAGYSDMKGKQIKLADQFLEKDLTCLTKEQKMEVIQKIMQSM